MDYQNNNINIIKAICINTINKLFPNIRDVNIIDDNNILLNKYVKIMIQIYTNILKYDLHHENLSINNINQDEIFNIYVECLLLMFPYVNTDLKILNKITNLNDLVNSNKYNKYIYDHTIINNKYNVSLNNSFEIVFNNNYKLLKNAIMVVKDRFYPNWFNICPIVIENFNDNDLLNNTLNSYNPINNPNPINHFKYIKNGTHENSHKILTCPTLFDTLYYLLNNCVKNYKCPINDNDFFNILQTNINEIRSLFYDRRNNNLYNHLWIYTSKHNQETIFNEFINKGENIRKNLIKLVIFYLYHTGTLNEVIRSEFNADKIKDIIKDRNFRKSNLYNDYRQYLLNELTDKYDDTYHYMNNKTQREIKEDIKKTFEYNIQKKTEGLINKGRNNNEIKEEIKKYKKDDVDNLKKHYQVGTDGTIYGLHWISQLKVFYHYLYNKVMFITGGTGVGKSTQIPKLICYATKAFSYLTNGKTICTQPRIRPTTDNMKYISQMTGIIQKEDKYNENMQYATGKHNKWRHYNITSTLFRMETDGILKASIFSNADLMIPLQDLTKELTNEYEKYKELYNILEGDDYVEINNPRLSPLKNIKNNINNIKYHETGYDENLDTNQNMLINNIIIDEAHEHNKNMDYLFTVIRSLLLETNVKLFIITATMDNDEHIFRNYYNVVSDLDLFNNNEYNAYYLDRRINISEIGKDTTFEIKDYYYNEINSEKDLINHSEDNKNKLIINNIKKFTKYKDILVFKAGQNEIINCVKTLNKEFKNMIALPYYASMNEDLKNFIEKDYNNKNIKLSKTELLNDNFNWNNFINNPDSKSYEHYIIVATNIAEASITIDTLTHLIDDGLQKTSYFDYTTLNEEIRKVPISESSRRQRKGRVGRIQEGYAYYLYAEGLLEKISNKPNYEITRSDNREFIFNCLYNDNIEYQPIQHKNYNFELETKRHNTLLDILKLNSIKNNENIINFDSNLLFDYEGTFYIFSPNEENAERNNILEYPYRNFNKINKYKFIDLKNIMQSYIDYGLIKYENNNLLKTNMGNIFNVLCINFEGNLNNQDIILLLNSYLFNITELSIDFISIIKNINLLSNCYKDFIDINNKTSSDILFIYNIVNKFNNIIYKHYNNNNNYLFEGLFIKEFNKIKNDIKDKDFLNNIVNNIDEFITNNRFIKNIIKQYGEEFNKFYVEYIKLKNKISISLIKSFHYLNINNKFIIDDLFNTIPNDNVKKTFIDFYNKINFNINDLKINHLKFNNINRLNDYDKLNYLLILSYYNNIFIQIPKEIIIDIPNFGKTINSNYLYMNLLTLKVLPIDMIDIKLDGGSHYKYIKSNCNVDYYILSFSYNTKLMFIHNIPNNLIKYLTNYSKNIINNLNSNNVIINRTINHVKQIIN